MLLELPQVVIIKTLFTASTIAAATSGADSTITLWSSVFPSLPMPEPLREAVSPLEDADAVATRFAAAVARGAVFPSTSTAFCDAAGLICDENIEVSSYSLHHDETTTTTTTTTHASRAASIKTINDFQFDFFLESQLVEGNTMRLAENLHDPIPVRAFLPRVVAQALPALTTSNLPKLTQIFNVHQTSPMATMMGTAAYLCDNPALPGEEKECPMTVDAMAQFVASQLGSTSVVALSTVGAPTTVPVKPAPVKVESFKKRSLSEGEHIIICHSLMFPSALYYCHHVTGTKVVQASLRVDSEQEGDDSGSSVIAAVGICHLDTSLWASEHPAFTKLNIPRGAEACHWLSQQDIVWVSTSTQ